MIIVTSDTIPGKKIVKTHGFVRGNTIRARNMGNDILASLRILVGGEIHEYTKLMAEAREQALDRMREEAEALGANAVVAVRFSTSEIAKSAAEILVYGTAVSIIETDESE
jgi:uncharacterized protein YbjQ (UPF0145 family)